MTKVFIKNSLMSQVVMCEQRLPDVKKTTGENKMKGLEGKEFEAIKAFVRRVKETGKKVQFDEIGKTNSKILTRIVREHSKGFIGCEMMRAKKELEKDEKRIENK